MSGESDFRPQSAGQFAVRFLSVSESASSTGDEALKILGGLTFDDRLALQEESGQPIAGHSEQPSQRFETEQQTTCHLVGSQCPDDVLVHCQDSPTTPRFFRPRYGTLPRNQIARCDPKVEWAH